eukprot:gnl/MRDRNA2_/MRDRNA2_63838_c0_seq1.p1 gnl/MRDRNA2_/MRDRNA2_63838_c0~~gnl/MRDRNA2_/MRDRNA2_63838_c0_seq1.p1  ORF type:complete len:204 (+),score=20.70 gnl/MRDRNA2_/MRDRNA2_63838_c0_seq1:224-835(+)
MIRNIPNRYTRKMLMDELDSLGFESTYDFIYVPMDKSTHWNVGYAFVNFIQPKDASNCMEKLTDYRFRRFRRSSGKVTQVSPAHIQGLIANMEHYSHTAVQSARIQSHRPLVLKPRGIGQGNNQANPQSDLFDWQEMPEADDQISTPECNSWDQAPTWSESRCGHTGESWHANTQWRQRRMNSSMRNMRYPAAHPGSRWGNVA